MQINKIIPITYPHEMLQCIKGKMKYKTHADLETLNNNNNIKPNIK